MVPLPSVSWWTESQTTDYDWEICLQIQYDMMHFDSEAFNLGSGEN